MLEWIESKPRNAAVVAMPGTQRIIEPFATLLLRSLSFHPSLEAHGQIRMFEGRGAVQ